MTVLFDASFLHAFEKITDASVARRADKAVEKIKSANSLREISNIKSMRGNPNYYRFRFGDFRIGFRMVDEYTIVLLAIEHRSVFYRHFP